LPVNELKTTSLYQYLVKLDEEYAGYIEIFVNNISPILSTIQEYFPYYTRHDAGHGYKVCGRISQIIDKDCLIEGSLMSFTAAEIFLLIASSYAHDLGMAVFSNEEDELCHSLGIEKIDGWKTNSLLQDYLRKNHSTRGGKYIVDNYDSLAVPKNIISPLNDMMRSHNLSISKLEFELKGRVAAQEKEINLKQLAVILCIADALEFGENRVVEGVLDSIKKDSSKEALISYRENMKHVCISDSVAVGNDGQIIFSGTFDDPEILSLAHNTIDNIETWVRGYYDIEKGSQVRRLKITGENISRKLEMVGADFERIGIRMDKSNIINLITSNAIWKSNSALCIKELLQNAVEACRYRKFHTSESKNYTPKITILFDRGENQIKISDDGCGMSKHIILNNFLTVGNSRAKDPSYSSDNYNSIARFGIGFWSIFTICKKAIIETAPFELLTNTDANNSSVNGCKFEISIEKLKDYTVFQEKQKNCGTSILLELKDEIIVDDVYEQLKHHIICSEIHIELLLDGEIESLPEKPIAISDKKLFGSKIHLKEKHSIQTYEWKGESNDIDIEIRFAYRMDNGHAVFMLDKTRALSTSLDNLFNASKVGVCGFHIPLRTSNLCLDFSRIGAFVANKTNPKDFEFSIDRQQLIESKISKEYSQQISSLIHNAYRDLLKSTDSYTPEYIYEMNMQSCMNGGNVYDQYTGDELTIAYNNHSDLLCFKLYEVTQGKNINEVVPIYVNLKSLLKMKGIVWVNQNSYTFNISQGNQSWLQAEQLIETLYMYVQSQIDNNKMDKHYVIEANRPASMLFDNDPASNVVFVNNKQLPIDFCFQKMSIENIQLGVDREDVFDGIRGEFSGAVYIKKFITPKNYPFVSLGRYRMLIQKGSKLNAVISELYAQKRYVKLAHIMRLCTDAEHGHIDDELENIITSIH